MYYGPNFCGAGMTKLKKDFFYKSTTYRLILSYIVYLIVSNVLECLYYTVGFGFGSLTTSLFEVS